MATLIETLAEFATSTRYEDLPAAVAEESRRLLLDSIGCALGGLSHTRGRTAVEYARLQGPGAPGMQATVIGTAQRASVTAATFANAELINALDFDAILPPGHVSPYVLPGALAVAEHRRSSGRELISAVAAAHEMSFRFGKAMSLNRDVTDGEEATADVLGYASTIFGATAAVARLSGLHEASTADAIAIAGSITPVNSHRAWLRPPPNTAIKYPVLGWLAQAALTAASMA